MSLRAPGLQECSPQGTLGRSGLQNSDHHSTVNRLGKANLLDSSLPLSPNQATFSFGPAQPRFRLRTHIPSGHLWTERTPHATVPLEGHFSDSIEELQQESITVI